MKPIGPLMWEHRLIEKMVALLAEELQRQRKGDLPNTALLFTGIDFFRMYVDRTHHGKEEEFLFHTLATKNLSEEHARILERLLDDHEQARQIVRDLDLATKNYVNQDMTAVDEIQADLDILTTLYPRHIALEDKEFFFPCLAYLTATEQSKMMKEFRDFDCRMIHEKYENTIETLEKNQATNQTRQHAPLTRTV